MLWTTARDEEDVCGFGDTEEVGAVDEETLPPGAEATEAAGEGDRSERVMVRMHRLAMEIRVP